MAKNQIFASEKSLKLPDFLTKITFFFHVSGHCAPDISILPTQPLKMEELYPPIQTRCNICLMKFSSEEFLKIHQKKNCHQGQFFKMETTGFKPNIIRSKSDATPHSELKFRKKSIFVGRKRFFLYVQKYKNTFLAFSKVQKHIF